MPRGFRDLRTAAELLTSARWPKEVRMKFSLPVPGKLQALLKKAQSIKDKVQNTVQQASSAVAAANPTMAFAIRGATAILAAQAAKQLQNATKGKGGKVVSSVAAATRAASIGAQIIEETDPEKIRNPQTEGPSINPAVLAKSISETAARSVVTSLVTKVPVATGLLPTKKVFKTLQSLKKSPRYFDITAAKTTTNPVVAPLSTELDQIVKPTQALYPQGGLLEDEIMYRLVLMAENVYYPINEYAQSRYGAIRILEGFRSQNSGKSLHERGEAFDFTLGDGSLSNARNLYNLAVWIRDHVIYDQLILCFSLVGTGQTWIHVSFTPDNRRRQVLTKTSNDLFLPGLHLYGAYADAGLYGRHVAEAEENMQLATKFSEDLGARDSRLNPIGVNTPEQLAGLGSGGSQSRCLVDPFGNKYVPDNSKEGAVIDAVNELLADPKYLEMVQSFDRTEMRPFAQEVAKRAGVGMNAVRGNASDASGDAIAILNPTGAKGFGSWDTDKRVQIMDIVGDAHGGPGSNPKAQWGDVTSVCADDPGGGYIEP